MVAGHWEQIYATRAPDSVGWYQAEPAVSLRLVESFAPDRSAPVVDVGGGASRLADRLLADGYSDVTVLDLAPGALEQVRQRLGDDGRRLRLRIADATTWVPDRRFALWHDRAVFHFLGDADARRRYVGVATAALGPGAALVLGTFAPDGPDSCSGLPVRRYGPADLAAEFGAAFEPVHEEREVHVTPGGVEQAYTWVVLRRGPRDDLTGTSR